MLGALFYFYTTFVFLFSIVCLLFLFIGSFLLVGEGRLELGLGDLVHLLFRLEEVAVVRIFIAFLLGADGFVEFGVGGLVYGLADGLVDRLADGLFNGLAEGRLNLEGIGR